MLTSVRLENFRCFKDVTVRLGPLTVLVGPNACGKTALLQMITSPLIGTPRDVFRHEERLGLMLTWITDAVMKKRHWRHGGQWEGEGHHRGQYLHFDVSRMRHARSVKQAGLLETDGANLADVLATLPRREQETLAQRLAALVPVLQDFHVGPAKDQQGSHRITFQDRWNDDVWYEPTEVSDGTILTLALLAVTYQKDPVDVIAIEEPEHGLHPYLVGEIVGVLRKLTTGEVGKRAVQVVLATQSAELLEYLEPDEVRFLSRSEDGSVEVHEAPVDTEDWREAYEAHQQSLGSLWLSGGAGGVPG